MSADQVSGRGMRACNERSEIERGLWTMLSRTAREHVEHDEGRTRVVGCGGIHELRVRNTGLVRAMRDEMAMREMEMFALEGR
jgi:hypothetical protein